MNEELFRQQLEQLNEQDWQSLLEGQDLLVIDDSHLAIGTPGAVNAILHGADYNAMDSFDLKKELLDKAGLILSNYYRIHPVTQTGFNSQVEKLIDKYGVLAFCAPQGKIANRTLFVEGGEVVAESADSPRHRYGVFFELEAQIPKAAVNDVFHKWLSNGEAYQLYLGMNVCRYNC